MTVQEDIQEVREVLDDVELEPHPALTEALFENIRVAPAFKVFSFGRFNGREATSDNLHVSIYNNFKKEHDYYIGKRRFGGDEYEKFIAEIEDTENFKQRLLEIGSVCKF